MSLKPKWQNFGKRNWEDIRGSWIAHVPEFETIGAPPDPGLEQLATLLDIQLPHNHDRFPDVEGLRRNALWEAVFLFHKCSHTNLAAQALGESGLHSWCLFNAYHSAYLGAKGIMALLGVALPNLASQQVAIDLYPEPLTKKARRRVVSVRFDEFLLVRLPLLDQRYLWEAFQRTLRMSDAKCWDLALRAELLNISFENFSRPRNGFLFKAGFWPLDDLITDGKTEDLKRLFGAVLDAEDKGFLLRLCFCVYRLFEQLMTDFAWYSAVIKAQLEASRCVVDPELPVLRCYRDFVSQVSN